VEVEGTTRDLHPILRDEVYRIAGEAVRNAFKHAQAQLIEVEIRYDERQLRVACAGTMGRESTQRFSSRRRADTLGCME